MSENTDTGYVRTVTGDIPANQLGIVLMHEHLVCEISPEQIIREEDPVADLEGFRRSGGTSIVELTNTGMGQDAAAIQRLSGRTGVTIVIGTGFYRDPWYPSFVRSAGIEELTDYMVRQIEEGVEGTGVRAGIVGEIGTSQEEITPDEAKVMRAAARAARHSGAPLSTHTSFGTFALEQLDLIEAEGLALDRVSVGHLDLIPDPDYHTAVAERGAYVQYDTFGKEQYTADQRRIDCLLEMLARGFEQQILLSNDISRATYLVSRGGWGYSHLLDSVVPKLRECGVSDSTLDLLLCKNPARFLRLVRGPSLSGNQKPTRKIKA